MITRPTAFVIVLLAVTGVVTAVSLSQSPAQEKEVSYPIQLEVDPNCKPIQPSTQVLNEKLGESQYQLHIINSVSYVVSEYKLGACKVLNPTGSPVRFSGFVPDELVPKFSEALWQYRAEEAGGKAELQKVLFSTRLVYGLNAEILYSEDLSAMKKLGIKYPDFVRPYDSFSSTEEMAVYYEKIYTPEWEEKNDVHGD